VDWGTDLGWLLSGELQPLPGASQAPRFRLGWLESRLYNPSRDNQASWHGWKDARKSTPRHGTGTVRRYGEPEVGSVHRTQCARPFRGSLNPALTSEPAEKHVMIQLQKSSDHNRNFPLT
jgi:hypothetical protein